MTRRQRLLHVVLWSIIAPLAGVLTVLAWTARDHAAAELARPASPPTANAATPDNTSPSR